MFLDRITLQLKAGNGGDGAVHFARIKYQPFAGPDGGDGGNGGSVVLVGDRTLEGLDHLRTANTTAPGGQPGSGNQKIGATAPDLEIGVPLGTVVEDQATGDELGGICAGGQRLVVAKGGRGGMGNPKYATGRRRTPRIAQPGFPGEERPAVLTYRIYCDTLLLEPSGEAQWQLLPLLLNRPAADVDWDLYRRRPRWIRIEHDFHRYDCAYLPFDVMPDGALEAPLIAHAYWARHICLNLCPLPEADQDLAAALLDLLASQPLRRAELVTLLTRSAVAAGPPRHAPFRVEACAAPAPAAALEAFLRQLTGDIAA
jgi:hypothetical protein